MDAHGRFHRSAQAQVAVARAMRLASDELRAERDAMRRERLAASEDTDESERDQ